MKNKLILTEVLKNSAKKYSDKPALTMKMGFRVVSLSYRQVYDLAKKVALFLKQQGVKPEDKVIICAPNSPYWMPVFFGCLLHRAIPVPLNIQSTEDIIRSIVDQTDAALMFKFQQLKVSLPENLKNFDLEFLPEYLENISVEEFEEVEISQEDLAQIMYTSGTTGAPKGVMLTHKNMMSNLEAVRRSVDISDKDRLLSILPLSHIFEQMAGFLMPFSYGAQIIYAHNHGAVRSLLNQYSITYMLAVPEFLQILLMRIEAMAEAKGKKRTFERMLRWSSRIGITLVSRFIFRKVINSLGGNLRAMGSGGAALDPEVQRKWIAMGINILPGYGLTETSPVVSTNTFKEFKIGSVGKPIDNVQVKLDDDGEILVKGPNVFKGYYKNQEATKESFTENGWYKTGDLGQFDSSGFLFIKGRKKYMILSSSGQNVYPEDIEFELNKIPGVQDSAVLGIQKKSGAVDIFAVLLLKPEAKVDLDEEIKKVNLKLASYQQINDWMIWPESDLPRTATKKVKKEELRKVILGSKLVVVEDELTGVSALKKIISDITGTSLKRIKNKSTIAQLGLDSLMRVELVSTIEEAFGVIIYESQIKPNTTVDEIEKLVEEPAPVKTLPKLKSWPRSWWARGIRKILQPAFLALLRIFIKLKVTGQENLEEVRYPVIFMANHLSYGDGAVVAMALKKIRNRLSFAAARDALYEEFKSISFLSDLLFNSFPMQRGDDDNIKLGLENIGRMLDADYSVVIFPEGHISKDGSLQPIKKGAGLIGVDMGVPIVPIKIEGMQDIFPYCKMWPRKRGTVTVKIGKPIKFRYHSSYQEATDKIEQALKNL